MIAVVLSRAGPLMVQHAIVTVLRQSAGGLLVVLQIVGALILALVPIAVWWGQRQEERRRDALLAQILAQIRAPLWPP